MTRLAAGCLLPPLGLILVAVTAMVAYVLWNLARYDAGPGIFVILPALVIGGWVCYGQAIWLTTAQLRNLRRLAATVVTVDAGGIAVDQQRWPWPSVRHIVVTRPTIPGQRMLLIDDGTGTPAAPRDVHPSLRRNAGWSLGTRRFAIDVPIDAFDVDADRLISAIRYSSGGRLPDLAPVVGRR